MSLHVRTEQKSPTLTKRGCLVHSNASKRKPGKSCYPLPPKENLERTPRETHCTDRPQISTADVSERPSSVDLRGVCANGTPTIAMSGSRKKTQIYEYTYTYV